MSSLKMNRIRLIFLLYGSIAFVMVFGFFTRASASYPPSLSFADVVCNADDIALVRVSGRGSEKLTGSEFDFTVVKNIVGNSSKYSVKLDAKNANDPVPIESHYVVFLREVGGEYFFSYGYLGMFNVLNVKDMFFVKNKFDQEIYDFYGLYEKVKSAKLLCQKHILWRV
ncbi:hypothetical protein M2375_004137 [Comamonas sp. BIGb0152]|uniref:hypothetical protein n=1 Tax=Comamonas sp. BIGb0152 TaxID=2940601 RepID=UPI0021683046|nr:hypothetical protein [Comamonas sp. BIGb0152]MCS4295887.1 hypothetical protein [Comamonas sp. BIGb0152]